MESNYNPQSIEQKWYEQWENSGYFAPADTTDKSYCIFIPPPNVTGTLHMGHAFQHTIMDILTRYHRMRGYLTLWQPGTDHAGIATQMVVERLLEKDGKSRHDIGRDAFIDKIWEWKEHSGGTIGKQMRRLGNSIDWSRDCFTMDEQRSKAVRKVFVELYNEGLIYRGKRLVNWDTVLQTAVSDLEVVNEDAQGSMWHIKYPLANGQGHLVVATTRPETMLGDVAVAVHPDDERYQALIGQMIHLPLTERQIPIIADEYVDPEFGTGCVKITPAHDFNDYEVGQRHQLEPINILTLDGKINDNAPKAYVGLDRFEARKIIVSDLDKASKLEKIEPHALKIPRGDRSNSVIEPMLTDQWFVNVNSMAEQALKVVEDQQIRFVPDNWKNTYYQWMRNIQDWCISRQLWWGHRIPAWYDENNNIYVGEDEENVRAENQLDESIVLTQENDVLDTWFSSALWPFSTLDWPDQQALVDKFLPSQVLVTGFDIIFFWVARMIMMTQKFTGKIPFKEVYITGLIRDEHGQKMSKSKGNVLDPIDIIDGIDLESLVEKRTKGMMQPQLAKQAEQMTRQHYPDGIQSYGTDALRFTFTALASTSRDINFDLKRVEGYRNFCNKLWNATRFIHMQCDQHAPYPNITDVELDICDEWILTSMHHLIADVEQQLEHYRFDQLAQAVYEFTWNQFCDWYLELCKAKLQSDDYSEEQKHATRTCLVFVLDRLLRILHPIIPFITEELWQSIKPLRITALADSLMIEQYPEANNVPVFEHAYTQIEYLKDLISSVRTIRSSLNVAPKQTIELLYQASDSEHTAAIEDNINLIKALCNAASVQHTDASVPAAATAIAGTAELFVPLAGLIDVAEEVQRLAKLISKTEAGLKQLNGKLSNENFVSRAPQAVVDKEKAKQAELAHELEKLKAQQQQLAKL